MKTTERVVIAAVTCAGVVGTAILSARSALKTKEANDKLPEEKKPKTWKEKAVTYWKLWIPTAACAFGTVGTVLVGHKVNTKEIAGLAAAAGLSGKSLDEVKKKVKDICGEETFQKIENEIANDHVADIKPQDIPEAADDVDISFGPFNGCQTEFTNTKDTLFYDSYTKQWFKSCQGAVQAGICHLNRNCQVRADATLKELYDLWGVCLRKDLRADLGWDCEELFELNELCWIDISTFKATKEDGTEYYIIEYGTVPLPLNEMMESNDISEYLQKKGVL